eukprot:g25317.t1
MKIYWRILATISVLFSVFGEKVVEGFGSTGKLFEERRTLLFQSNTVERSFIASHGSKVSLTPCNLSKIDIFLVVCDKCYLMFKILMDSVRYFFPCHGIIHVLTDNKNSEVWKHWSGRDRIVLHDSFWKYANVPFLFKQDMYRGYMLQQIAMMWADKYAQDVGSDAEYIMFLDADSVLGLPVTCKSLFSRDGRLLIAGWDIYLQEQYRRSCQLMLNTTCDISYMAFFPFTMPMSLFQPMRDKVVHSLIQNAYEGKDFNALFDAWARTSPGIEWTCFSQFVVMGNYLQAFSSDLVQVIHCPDHARLKASSSCFQFVPHGHHMGQGYKHYLGLGSDDVIGKFYPEHVSTSVYAEVAKKIIHDGLCSFFYNKTKNNYNHNCLNQSQVLNYYLDLYPNERAINISIFQDTFRPESSCQ